MPPKKNEIAPVLIDTFSKKGHGIGTTVDEKQRKVEVPFSIPGDTISACLFRKRGGIYTSRSEAIIQPSPVRIEPRCVHFGTCGGCRWQQMPYEKQLQIKQEKIDKLFSHLLDPATKSLPIIACNPPWHYRNKMEFSFSSDASGKKYLGLIIDGSRGKVFNMTECHLVNPWMVDALKAARQWWMESDVTAFHPHANKGSLRTLTVREGLRSGDRAIMLTVSGNPEDALNKQQLNSFVAFLRAAIEPLTNESHLCIMLRIQQAFKGQETSFYEMLLHGPDHIREVLHVQTQPNQPPVSLKFSVSPSAFFQPNTRQAEVLYSRGLQLLDIPAKSVIYDLYCGTGTLGICAAHNAKMVVGIEISPESSLDARTNAANNGLKNVHILTGPVKDVVKDIRQNQKFPLPDVVMVDPPRVGLDPETIRHLAELNPHKLLYISCNPVTQAENIAELKTLGYEISAIQPVDQFPHTVHIENIVVLTKRP